jgi:N-methylhydantoinase A
MTIQRGIDPREFALLSFGGAGPVQSGAVAQLIGMKACIVPPSPGNLSAFGLLAVDWRNDQIGHEGHARGQGRSRLVAELYAGLERDAIARLEQDGIARDRIRLVREADLRYAGQSMEVRVWRLRARSTKPSLPLIDAFHAAHRRTFGYDYKGEQKTEIVNLRVSGFGMIERPSLPKLAGHRRESRRPRARAMSGSTAPCARRKSTTGPRCRSARS